MYERQKQCRLRGNFSDADEKIPEGGTVKLRLMAVYYKNPPCKFSHRGLAIAILLTSCLLCNAYRMSQTSQLQLSSR